MLAVFLALGLVGGLIGFAAREAVSPTIKPDMEIRRLEKLKKKFPMVTLDEAEDGAVLSRRYGDKGFEGKFVKAVLALRKNRIPV